MHHKCRHEVRQNIDNCIENVKNKQNVNYLLKGLLRHDIEEFVLRDCAVAVEIGALNHLSQLLLWG